VLQAVNHTLNQRARFVAFPEGPSGELVILDGRIVDLNGKAGIKGCAVVSLFDLRGIAEVL